MKYVGIDVHKRFFNIALEDEKGRILVERKFVNNSIGIEDLVNTLTRCDKLENIKVVMESTGNYWYTLFDRLEEVGCKVFLANPVETKAIARKKLKNDKLCAKVLADLLRGDFVIESYVPPRKIRDRKQLLRHRISLTSNRTRVKNQIHAIIDKHHLKYEYTDMFGKSGMKWLEQIITSEQFGVSTIDKSLLKTNLELIKTLNEQINFLEIEIAKIAVKEKDVKILMTIPGIDFYSAMLILTEIGDVNRFISAEKLASYVGLVPTTKQSGGRIVRGRITKQGPRKLRWILIQVAQVAKRYDDRSHRFYERIAKRRGPNIATVALARQLLTIIYSMLKRKEPYRDYKSNLTNRKLKRMKRLSNT